MCEVYKNKDVIQTSLTIANGFIFGDDYYDFYLSSSDAGFLNFMYYVAFFDGKVFEINKSNAYDVFVLHALNAE